MYVSNNVGVIYTDTGGDIQSEMTAAEDGNLTTLVAVRKSGLDVTEQEVDEEHADEEDKGHGHRNDRPAQPEYIPIADAWEDQAAKYRRETLELRSSVNKWRAYVGELEDKNADLESKNGAIQRERDGLSEQIIIARAAAHSHPSIPTKVGDDEYLAKVHTQLRELSTKLAERGDRAAELETEVNHLKDDMEKLKLDLDQQCVSLEHARKLLRIREKQIDSYHREPTGGDGRTGKIVDRESTPARDETAEAREGRRRSKEGLMERQVD